MKILWSCCILTLACAALAGQAHGADGKALFLTRCGICHKSGGEAAAFAPTKYASTQWERFFTANKHARIKDISQSVTADENVAIKDYLKSHAADSDQPEAVGLK
jgi:mono/diheme cytochrome c family protein